MLYVVKTNILQRNSNIHPYNPNPHLFKIRTQKQMGGTCLWYCKLSHADVVFIILVVQIFCLKCIYHFAGLLFSYLSFCRFTLLNIQKVLSFSWVIIFQICFLILRRRRLEFIIFLGKVCTFHFRLGLSHSPLSTKAIQGSGSAGQGR